MIKFGTGGFRAIIGDDFTRANLELLSQALVNKMRREGCAGSPVIVGYDRRFLSDIGAHWICAVFAANGVPCKLIDFAAPTPLIMFTVKTLQTQYGMAITASHNPAEYNGVKIFTAGGRDATEEVTNDLEKEIAAITAADVRSMDYDKALSQGLVEIIDPTNQYIDSILSFVDVDAIKDKALKVLIDPMYGVSKNCLQTLLLTCRCDVSVIHERHDPLFGGRVPAPSADTLKALSNMVVEGHYDLGIATDGDADRIGLIDSEGNYIHPNDILVLLYYYLHEFKGWKGPVVRNIATTHMLDRMAKDFGEICYEVPVGFKHISFKMDEQNALIGGESSGGLTVRGHISGKDGVYAAALLVEMICRIGKPLSVILRELHDKYGHCHMSEFNVSMAPEKKVELQKLLFEEHALPQFPIQVDHVSYEDGCKVYFKNDGWIICRFSGTEPVIRIFCEQENEQKANEIIKVFRSFLGL